MRSSAGILAVVAALLAAQAHTKPIESINPSDGIASIRINANIMETEIHVTFSEDMIPLGGGHGDFPVTLEGPGSCNWGWRGPRTLSCLLGRDDRLPMAEQYALVIEDGLTAISGTPVPPFRLEFETDSPVVSHFSVDWDGPTAPVIYVYTNVPVSTRELQRRITLVPLSGSSSPVHVKVDLDPDPNEYMSDEQQFAIRPVAELSADTGYVVRVGEGLAGTDSGLAGTPHDAGAFRTHAPFRYMGIGCGPHADRSYWEHQYPLEIPAEPDCAPEQHVSLLFSSPPEIRGLYSVLTKAGLAPPIAATLGVRQLIYERGNMVRPRARKAIYALQLSGFPAGATNSITLPAIADRFGRRLEPLTVSFPTRDFVPAFLNRPSLAVVASGSGDGVEFATVNSEAIAARLHRGDPSDILSLSLAVESPGVNERGRAVLNVEAELGKSWGVLVGEVAITHRALVNKQALRGFPIQYAQHVGAILSPWDVIVAAKGLGLKQRHSIWVSSLETGEPVAGATVELLERSSNSRDTDAILAAAYRAVSALGAAQTDKKGFAEIFPTPNSPTNSYPTMVRVTKDDTVVVLPIEGYQFVHGGYDQPDYRFNIHYPSLGYVGEGAVITWGVTDKPLYHSGETVHIKGYVRVRDDNRLVIPGEKNNWDLSCESYPNNLCAGRTVDLDDYGAFEATLELPESVLDGEYKIAAQSEFGGMAALSFQVANYKPNPHRVQLELVDERVIGDEPLRLNASAEYFAGGALKNADAQVIIETRSDFAPVPEPLLENYYFGPLRWYGDQGVPFVTEAEFDADGRLSGSFPLPPNSPANGIAKVTVAALHDGGEWAYSDQKEIEFSQNRFMLGLQHDEEVISAGEAYQAGVILLDLQGAGDDELSVIQNLEYPNYSHRSKAQPIPEVGDDCTVDVKVDELAYCELTPTRLGRAVIRARLMRGSEEVLQVERDVTVAVPGQRPWNIRASASLDLQVQAEEFDVGQTAEILVDVPYDKASVLFSIHRNFVFDQWREVLPKGENRIRIPLTEKHAPGFTFTAIARPVGSRSGTSIGSASVKVRSARIVPTLAIDTDRDDYKTGEQVKLVIHSTAPGKTQLAVAVVDSAVLDLVPNVEDLFDPQSERFAGVLDMWGAFRWWQLSRAMGAGNLPDSQVENTLAMLSNGARSSGQNLMAVSADRGMARPGSDGPSLRHDFVEAAYFNPTVITSDAGVAEIDFTVPDNLGKWRVVVIGTDTEGQLFANFDTFNVALPLEIRADLPDRLIVGDSLQARASVLNRKSDAAEVTMSVEIDAGNGNLKRETQTSTLGSMESFSVAAAIGPVAGQQVRLQVTANDIEDADGLSLSTPVNSPVESRSWTAAAPLSASNIFVQPVELPVNALESSVELRVTLDKSVIGDLSQVFHYMNESSHQSWEQILSRAVVAAYANTWDEAGAYRMTHSQMLNQLMQGSNFQSAGGGMSHFEPREDRSNDYLSAYTILALDWIEKQGFEIPAYRQRLFRYVHQRIRLGMRGRKSYDRMKVIPSTRDMPVLLAALSSSPWGLSGQADQYMQYLRNNVAEFDVDGLAYALIAATNANAAPELRADIAGRLQARLVETFDRTEISGGNYRFSNRNELYCVVLNALQGAREFVPEPRALAKLIRGGYEFREQTSGFGNTHANALCVAAMTKYRDVFEAPAEFVAARVTAPRLTPFDLSIDVDEVTKSSDGVPLPMMERKSEVSVSLTAGTSGYASTNVRYNVDLSREIERSHGFTIKRSYSVHRRNKWRPLNANSRITQGEWIRIELDVITPVVRRFVAITDPTPAGLEPVDTLLLPAVPGGASRRVQWWYAFNQQALSNVQSRFYAEWLSAGSHNVTYYAQAKFAGEFMALPAKIESMYSDGVFAITAPTIVRVEAAD